MCPRPYLFPGVCIQEGNVIHFSVKKCKGDIQRLAVVIGYGSYEPSLPASSRCGNVLSYLPEKNPRCIPNRGEMVEEFHLGLALIIRRFVVPENKLERAVIDDRQCRDARTTFLVLYLRA